MIRQACVRLPRGCAIGRMMRLTFVATALAAAAVAAAATTSGATVSAANPSRPPTAGSGYASSADLANGGPIHGMILSDAPPPFGANIGDLQRLADDGVNMVSLYVGHYFTSPYDPRIVTGPLTPT